LAVWCELARRDIPLESKQLGQASETLACELLKKRGYKIIERNKRTHYGEIDILAEDGKTLVIVEVKAKSSERYGSAIEMITAKKRTKLILLVAELQSLTKRESVRLDVVTVDNASGVPLTKLYKGVIEAHG
jgi:putative endonuclease